MNMKDKSIEQFPIGKPPSLQEISAVGFYKNTGYLSPLERAKLNTLKSTQPQVYQTGQRASKRKLCHRRSVVKSQDSHVSYTEKGKMETQKSGEDGSQCLDVVTPKSPEKHDSMKANDEEATLMKQSSPIPGSSAPSTPSSVSTSVKKFFKHKRSMSPRKGTARRSSPHKSAVAKYVSQQLKPKKDKRARKLFISNHSKSTKKESKVFAWHGDVRRSPRKHQNSGLSQNHTYRSDTSEDIHEQGAVRRSPRKHTASTSGSPSKKRAKLDSSVHEKNFFCHTSLKLKSAVTEDTVNRENKPEVSRNSDTTACVDVGSDFKDASRQECSPNLKEAEEMDTTSLSRTAKVKLFPIFSGVGSTPPRQNRTSFSGSPVSSVSSTSPILGLVRASKAQCRDRHGREQMIIDAGQKKFGATQCTTCQMVYMPGDPDDETAHSKFHQRLQVSLRFLGWKKERVVRQYHDGRVIMVLPSDPKYSQKKVDEIRHIVDLELGFTDTKPQGYPTRKTFLFISDTKKVVGCCVAEETEVGFRVLSDSKQRRVGSPEERQRSWCCSTKPEPVHCGISRVWVLVTERKKHIATRLLECVRDNFTFGCTLSKQSLAFSDPTPDGRMFATKYMGTPNFLVYKYQ